MQKYLLIVFFSYLFVQGFGYWLKFINLRHMKKHGMKIPYIFEGYIDESLLKKIHAYTIENGYFSFIKSISGNVVVLIFFFGGLLKVYNSWISSLSLSFIPSGILFFLLLSYGGTFLSIPLSLYDTFKIENKYGFNTLTPKLWIMDFIKSLVLSTILIGIVISIGLWLIQSSPDYWWIWVWCFYLIFSLFIMYISPYVIEPLFNKFTPIEEEGLVKKIKDIMQKVGIKVSRVFRMDASKRSRHTNAYFSGIGKVKRIIIYDTLLEKMEPDEIVAVLSHEAGHWKKKHILKLIILSEIISFISIFISFKILQTNILTDLFQIEPDTFFAKVVILGFIGSIVSFPFIPLSNYISRRFERQADRFACELMENRETIAKALIKLSKDNLSNLYPHPLYAAFYYSHPAVVQRINSILGKEPIS
jgi:STE24 endopeptidase